MENNTSTTPLPYQDPPTSSDSSIPQASTQLHPQPQGHQHSPSSSISTIKPLPALPHENAPPTYEAYRDDPSDEPYRDDPSATTASSPPQQQLHHHHQQQRPYTNISPPLTPLATPLPDDDNIPLAHLLLTPNPYPLEAPPSYAVAIRQTRSRRDTLIQYIPSSAHEAGQQGTLLHGNSLRSVIVDIDEETGEVLGRTDDVRHSVEKVVAMFVVAIVLLVVSGVLMWLALGAGLSR